MGKTNGWIKLDRGLKDNIIWQSLEPFDMRSAWIDLLLSVNHVPHDFVSKGQKVHLEPGQMVTSENILADRWHWSRGKVRRTTKMWKNLEMITTHSTSHGTTITIVNWAKYQGSRPTLSTASGTPDGTTGGTLYKNIEKNEKKKRSSAPKSLEEKLEAMRRYASGKGEE